MSEYGNISWTDSTWRWGVWLDKNFGTWKRTSPATFKAPLRWNREPWVCNACGSFWEREAGAAGCPCEGHSHARHKRRVFCGSLMDWLWPRIPVQDLADGLDIIRRCPDLTFQLLTKRPELFYDRMECALVETSDRKELCGWIQHWMDGQIIPKNIQVLTSIEDQRSTDQRIPHLLEIPAIVRGLSVEPILERVDLRNWTKTRRVPCHTGASGNVIYGTTAPAIDWVIVGGESGPNRREAQGGTIEAITDIVRQCASAGVPCFVKQDCAAKPGQQGRIPDDIWSVKQFPV